MTGEREAAQTRAGKKNSYCLIFCEKSFLRWCIASNLLANQRTFSQSCTLSTLLLIRLDLPATLPHTASTGWIESVFAVLTNHNLCDMFYTLTEMFVYKLLLGVHKIWDITKF